MSRLITRSRLTAAVIGAALLVIVATIMLPPPSPSTSADSRFCLPAPETGAYLRGSTIALPNLDAIDPDFSRSNPNVCPEKQP